MIKPHATNCIYHTSRKINYWGMQASNMGGWQGIFDVNVEWFIPFELEVLAKSKIMMQKYNPKFDMDSLRMNSWANINCFGDYNVPHTHPPIDNPSGANRDLPVLSGVYYITKPKDSGDLIMSDFSSNMKRLYGYNFDHKVVASEGECILFFPDMPHYVEPSQTHEDRISIAFNLDI